MSREIDQLVADKVMGWEMTYYTTSEKPKLEGFDESGNIGDVPNYSEDWNDMALVIKHLLEKYEWRVYIETEFDFTEAYVKSSMGGYVTGCVRGDTTPLAVCLAALEAVEVAG